MLISHRTHLMEEEGVGEPGREIQQPMAVVILGGIATSTFFNMIVIPALYLKYGRAKAPFPARDKPAWARDGDDRRLRRSDRQH